MKFISAEQFSEQPVEVQKVLLEWWKPNNGDIFAFSGDDTSREIGVLGASKEIQIATKGKGEYRLPLLTEGQLRQFIEDKTGYKIDSMYFKKDGYTIGLTDGENIKMKKEWDYLDNNLLQAYWKVALEIAKEKVKS